MCTNAAVLYAAGVHFSLRGTEIANNSFVDIDSIGSDDTGALLCHTDNPNCCNSTESLNDSVIANWYFDNGTAYEQITATDKSDTYFVSNRGEHVIKLLANHNPKNTVSVTGDFSYEEVGEICYSH